MNIHFQWIIIVSTTMVLQWNHFMH